MEFSVQKQKARRTAEVWQIVVGVFIHAVSPDLAVQPRQKRSEETSARCREESEGKNSKQKALLAHRCTGNKLFERIFLTAAEEFEMMSQHSTSGAGLSMNTPMMVTTPMKKQGLLLNELTKCKQPIGKVSGLSRWQRDAWQFLITKNE